MSLLLLLSALLSALTGVGAGARAPDRAQTVAEASIGAVQAATVRRSPAVRPLAVLPTIAAIAPLRAACAIAPVAVEPIFATRRRE
ncbi:hypothetical protein F1C10_04105 [Sphingomonas sp. NBWT7]|uniref:hypothetical protein n=1 Tax=Sphingomonas sp. NBWT7 TaxID=2596913 RepID=UPI001624154D|nr:hypothetical protein [Sphingomonas sp. NBWT7]QNE31201.1 hypothetical protein F1C10_04105 [Sphingomonas sp. NBWT7]